MPQPNIREFPIHDEALKSIENDVYDINTRSGIKIKMKSNRLLEKIHIPYNLLTSKELEGKIVEAINEASELVSSQVSEDIFRILLKKGLVPTNIEDSSDYD